MIFILLFTYIIYNIKKIEIFIQYCVLLLLTFRLEGPGTDANLLMVGVYYAKVVWTC